MCSPRRTVPAAGSASPASTRASVVLPAPFRPTRPTLSPGPIWKLAPSSSSCAPARSSRPDAAITRTTPTARTGESGDAAGHDQDYVVRATLFAEHGHLELGQPGRPGH